MNKKYIVLFNGNIYRCRICGYQGLLQDVEQHLMDEHGIDELVITEEVGWKKEYENCFPEDARARKFDGGF